MIGTSGQQSQGGLEQQLAAASDASTEKYGLRPRTIIKRLQHEKGRKEAPKARTRPKSRPAPLSKYRRKTANARERHRMKEINNAFESLRKVLPDALEVPAATSTMTKITTLRLAVSYIRALSDVLEDESDTDICSLQNSLQFSLQHSLEQSLQSSVQNRTDNCFHLPIENLCKPSAVEGISMPTTFQYTQTSPSRHYNNPQPPQMLSYYSTFSNMSGSAASFSTSQGSLGSTSDLDDLLSDDSSLLEDNLDDFHDIPTLSVADPLEFLLEADKDTLSFTSEL